MAPQFDANGNKLSHWESMEKLDVGDIVFNYAKGRLRGYALVLSAATPTSRPYTSGTLYSPSQGGRIVFCDYRQLPPRHAIPLANLMTIQSLKVELSSGTNSVINSANKVSQKYLCPITSVAGTILMSELGKLGLPHVNSNAGQSGLSKTTVKLLIDARVGQGKFRKDLLTVFSGACAITGLTRTELLRASHIKSWSDSNNSERLDPENGLILAAGIDAAFDKGLISFDPAGLLLTKLSSLERSAIGIPQNARLPKSYLTTLRLKFLDQCRKVSKFSD